MTVTLTCLVLLSALIHAAWNLAAKRVAGDIGVMWLGQVVAAVVILPFALATMPSDAWDPSALRFIILTGLVQAAYFGVLSKAYAIGDLSVVYPIARGVGVAGAAVVSMLVLSEDMSAIGMTGIGLVCTGSFILGMSRMTRLQGKIFGMAVLIGLLLTAGTYVDKMAVDLRAADLHPFYYIFWMFLMAILASSPFAATIWRPRVSHAWRHHKHSIAVVGLGSMIGYLIILFAFRIGPLGYIVAFRESSVLLSAGLGFFMLRESIQKSKIIGILVILGGLMLIQAA